MTVINLTSKFIFKFNNQSYRLVSQTGLNELLVKNLHSSELETISLDKLLSVMENAPNHKPAELSLISEDTWNATLSKYKIIKPLLDVEKRTKQLVDDVANANGVHTATIYRWLLNYSKEKTLTSLVGKKPGRKQGSSLLDAQVEEVISKCIIEHYLTSQKCSAQKTCEEILRVLKSLDLPAPHPNTIRNRINNIPVWERLKNREGSKVAREKLTLHISKFEGAQWPLAIVQIDHTKLDIILVDAQERKPIGRPWITVAIDVFSRMVVGVYVSLDAPGALSVGMCLSHAILPKDSWLAKRNIDTEWPVFGLMDVIHADNAKEFRGEMLTRACQEYGIDIHWRPVGRPHFGGHIERLLGTFNQDLHTLPGTTFSSVKKRGAYDSTKNSALTLEELEQWLCIYITKVYHNKFHKGIQTTPLALYEQGVLGTDEAPGRGIPRLASDPNKLRLDFMPVILRTVQRYGVAIDEIHYYHDVLRPWIEDIPGRSKKKQHIFRRDPRDISSIFFWDPELGQYFEIPYRTPAFPVISLWELREVRQQLKTQGVNQVNETLIFSAYEEMKQIRNNAVVSTKKLRRQGESKKAVKRNPVKVTEHASTNVSSDDWLLDEDIAPFDDIDVSGVK